MSDIDVRWLRAAYPTLQELRIPLDLMRHWLAGQSHIVLVPANAADAVVAYGCLTGNRRALARFERDVMGECRALAQGVARETNNADELVDVVRTHVLQGRDERGPRLATYTGRGPLRTWIRVVTTHVWSTFNRQGVAAPPPQQVAADQKHANDQLDLVRSKYQPVFVQALSRAAEHLPQRDQHLLQLHFADGASTSQIAKLMRSPQSTVEYWLRRARQRLAAEAGEAGSALTLDDSTATNLWHEVLRSLAESEAIETKHHPEVSLALRRRGRSSLAVHGK